jgi:DNA-directed RNA polymerase subunit RPC12/RpoP
MLQAVYAPDAWVIPPSDDGTHPGVRRRDLVTGPIGYWPEANRIGGNMLYTCAVCDEDVAVGTESTLIVSGAVEVCPRCGGETVFDLSTPETRAEPYRLVEDLSIAAGFVGAVNAETMKARVDELHERISWLMNQVLKWQKLAGAQRLDEHIGEEQSTD